MYKAPIDDMTFALETLSQEMPHLAQSLPDAEMIDVILTEAGKLAGDVIAPLNHEADKKGGAVRQDDGSVKTPDGFCRCVQTACRGRLDVYGSARGVWRSGNAACSKFMRE